MKVVITGSRHIDDDQLVRDVVEESGFEVDEVVSGGASGIDVSGEHYAKDNKLGLTYFPARWYEFGKAAGPIRNKLMAEYADALIAIWDGDSRGTRNMIEQMEKLEKPIYIENILGKD